MTQGERGAGEYPVSQLEQDYSKHSDAWRRRFPRTAKVMVQTGVAQGAELDFILGKQPELVDDWIEATPSAQSIMEEFSLLSNYRSWALAETFHLKYDRIYRILAESPIRPHLGDVTYQQRARPFWVDPPARVRVAEPDRVDLTDIRRNYYIALGFSDFSRDASGYLEALTRRMSDEPDARRLLALQQVYDFYCKVSDLTFPTLTRQLFDQLGQPRRDNLGNEIFFPSDHQKAAIVKAAQEGSLAVFDGTGSGKTGIGIGLAEYIGAERVLVVCPSSVKDTWQERVKEYYLTDPGVIRIKSGNRRRVANGEKYTVINYELLINRSSNTDRQVDLLSPIAHRLLDSHFDLLIIDEAHYINNPNKRSDAVLELARRADRRLILTATPIRNSADDITRIAYLLSPNEFTSPEALRDLGESGIPSLVQLLATKTIRRQTADLVELPPFCPENNGETEYVQVDLNPTQRAVYDAIQDDSALEVFSKIELLRLAAIDHNLVRGKKYKIPFEEKQAVRELDRAYKAWVKQKQRGIDVVFDSDFLVTHGFRHLFIGAHLYYRKGMDQLIQKQGNQELREAWKVVVESTKFQRIGDLIRQRLAKGEKVVVFSSRFVKGVLREKIDDVTGEAIMEDLYSFLTKEFPGIGIGRIDGAVTPNARNNEESLREKERERWQNDPKLRILLTSVQCAALGIDFTVNDGVTKGVGIIGVDLPYTHAELWQMISRVYRFGQLTPVNAWIIEALRTIDLGMHVLDDKKQAISEDLLDGLSPDELARQLMERSKAKSFLVDYITSPKQELERRFYAMRGRGVTANGAYLEEVLADGKTVGETIAELYSRYWEYTYSGHTARLLQQVIDGLRKGQKSKFNLIMDAGSGPLILDRVMRQESDAFEGLRVISVDINKHMLESGVAEIQKVGYTVDRSLVRHRSMADTGIIDGVCDGVVCSLAFHYSSSSEDRGKILAEANRILRLGGYYFITLPGNYLSPEQYQAFSKGLRKFGFEVDRNISGKVKALDYKDVPFEVWLVAARKVGVPTGENLTMEEFRFNFEGPKISRYKGDQGTDGEEDKQSKDQERLVKHEKFQILDPENSFRPKGSPAEILGRLGLGWDEDILRRYGWRVETRRKGDDVEVVFKR